MFDFWRCCLPMAAAAVSVLAVSGGCERPSVRVEATHVSASKLDGINVTYVGAYRDTYGPVRVTFHNDLPKSIDVLAVEVWSMSSTGRGTVELREIKPPLPLTVEGKTASTVEGYISISYEKTARFLAKIRLGSGEVIEVPVARK